MRNLDFRVRDRAVGDLVYKICLLYVLQNPHPYPLPRRGNDHGRSTLEIQLKQLIKNYNLFIEYY